MKSDPPVQTNRCKASRPKDNLSVPQFVRTLEGNLGSVEFATGRDRQSDVPSVATGTIEYWKELQSMSRTESDHRLGGGLPNRNCDR